MIVLEDLEVLVEFFTFSFFNIIGWGIDLDTMILNGMTWELIVIVLWFLRLHPSTAFWTLVDCDGYSIFSKGFLPQ